MFEGLVLKQLTPSFVSSFHYFLDSIGRSLVSDVPMAASEASMFGSSRLLFMEV